MKKFVLAVIITASSISLNAQSFGIRAGIDFATATAKFDGLSVSENETGFYIGLFSKFNVSEKFDIRPEVNYVNIKDLDQIQVPVLAEIGLSDKFSLLAGPSFGFILDKEEGVKSFNLGVDLGLSYNISEKFLVEARYDLGISDLAEDNEFDASLKLSGFQIGIGYLF